MRHEEWYEAGRTGGRAPSARFDLDSSNELISPLLGFALRERSARVSAWSQRPLVDAWRDVCRELCLTDAEAAWLLGVYHDAVPETVSALPPSILIQE